MNILLVIAEDRAICESLRAALPEKDLVLAESSVDKALRRLISMKVDAVVIDDAPSLGHHALSRVLETVPTEPTVILSSRSDSETLAGWTLAGARGCVVKPFSCESLGAALEGVLQGREPRVVESAFPAAVVDRAWSAMPEISKSAAIGQHQMALRWVSRTSGHIEDPHRLSQSLIDAATDIFDTVRCAVLLESNGHVRVVASHGVPPSVTESLRLSYTSGLMRWFEQNACLFDRFANTEAISAVKEMRAVGGCIGVPLLTHGRVCGAIIIGEKASGPGYSLEERELLTILARCASTALEKAQVYRETSTQQSRLDTILANIAAGVVCVLPNRTISMMNQQAENILRVRAVDVLGRSVQKLGSGFSDVVLRTLADNKPRLRQEIRDVAVNATLGLSVTPMGAEGVVAIFSKLPEESVSKNDVAYSPFWEYLSERVAQEIKNPMVAINTFAQLLPRKYDSEDFRDAFSRVVQKEVARINGVVETLYSFATHPELMVKRSDLNETVRSVLKAFDEELATHAIKVETQLDPSVSEAEFDAEKLTQAIHSVVQNSVEAMPSGGTLTVRTSRDHDTCHVVVADTGPGVSREHVPMIFMPFYSTKERGMGLGLPTAMRIVRQHNGEMRLVETPEGTGAVFQVSFPAAQVAHEDDSGR